LPVETTLTPKLDDLSLSAEAELQLLRIVQESLTNTRKHASATRVWVGIQNDDGVLRVEVRDDGCGFDPKQIRTDYRPHLGLSSMRERAEAIGADFDLLSSPGQGTRVVVRLKLVEGA
jgi:signal transduction histidine kinase